MTYGEFRSTMLKVKPEQKHVNYQHWIFVWILADICFSVDGGGEYKPHWNMYCNKIGKQL